ncbi:hypothetical protein SAMN05444277_107189 [Parafilimonas terrae]|uniref:O-Antigen ligase n=1 Tax=Parafilimonas terrae TaxID=1465490 RepID=A0A1I5X406_9BACT|nr:hypothetical protein SAMN05444277_107189 [Parafilimonas terrae]
MQDISLQQHSPSMKVWRWILIGIYNFLLVLILLFCTVNKLTSVPIDKILVLLSPFLVACFNPDKKFFTSKEFLVIILFTIIAVTSSVANLCFYYIIFFPIIGLSFSIILSQYKNMVLFSLYYALFLHIVIGIVILVLAFMGFTKLNVSEGAKGIASLYSTHGFTSTVQTYGTLCITWLLLYLLRKKLGLNTIIDRLFFFITTLAILLTFNRSTYLFWVILLFFEFPRMFWSIAILMGAILVKFWTNITSFILSSSTIEARFQLLQGFNISYMQSGSLKVYLFGRGTNQISQEVANKVKWSTRLDLENGYTMLLHSYGLIGLCAYLFVCFYFIFLFLKINRFKEAFFLFFYFFVTQYITQEFVATTFYMFLAVMLATYDYYKQPNKFTIG